MARNLNNPGAQNSDTDSPAPLTLHQDTYVVLNLLPPSRVEWLRQQSLRVAALFRQSSSPEDSV
jgi:hypothetical protein